MKGVESFGVDHYRPKSRFPELRTVYSNLYYCCNPCNSRKGNYWPQNSRVATDFIPNPCDHEMFRHLRFKRAIVVSRTHAGAIAMDCLDLNEDEVVGFRTLILSTIGLYEEKIAETEATLSELRALLESAKSAPTLSSDIATLERDLDTQRRHLNRLCGVA